MKYVIIGNSAAAVGAVEAIRKNDKDGQIIMLSSETYHTYSRPLISYMLLGKTTEEKMKYRDDNFYNEKNVDIRFGKTVVKIDSDKKQVIMENGESESYDKLLVAVGSRPFVPPLKGLDVVKNKFTFTTLSDAKALGSVVKQGSRVLIVGAGLIGLKCAEGISAKAVCTCVDLAPKVLSSILDDEAASIVKEHLENHGMKFHLGHSVAEFKENLAILDDGTEVPFDIVVTAVGVRPNISLIKDIGGDTNRGICINEKAQTSIKDIYAAGDCAESYDASSGQMKVMALLPNAYMQGECAGMNMSGSDYVFNKAIPMNAIGFFGLHIISAGSYIGEVYKEHVGQKYKKLFYDKNVLHGFILINEVEKAGIYTSLIREKTPLDTVDFELLCEQPGMVCFSKAYRKETLGGVKE